MGLMPMSQRHYNAPDQLLNESDVEYRQKQPTMMVVTHRIANVRRLSRKTMRGHGLAIIIAQRIEGYQWPGLSRPTITS